MNPDFLNSDHGDLGCTYCHKGNNVDDFEKAHQGIVEDPSEKKDGVCSECHEEITETFYKSMHFTIRGIKNVMQAYISPQPLEKSPLETAFKIDCNSCHATCGSCHVSRPKATKGGLMGAHRFFKEPPMAKTCYGCHGARTGGEFTGKIGPCSTGDEVIPDIGPTADVHFFKYQMICSDCHAGEKLHSALDTPKKTRYYNIPHVQCEDCHKKVKNGEDGVAMHKAHPPNTLACQTCHSSGGYHNCFNCHVLLGNKGKEPIPLSDSKILFKIGLNPDPGPYNKYKYVLLRHSPVTFNSFSVLGINFKPNFNRITTWGPMPVHNIQKNTPQNAGCNSCHGHPELFINEKDLQNASGADRVLIPKVPPAVENKETHAQKNTVLDSCNSENSTK